MTYTSWIPRYRVMTEKPCQLDLFVLTLIDGRRAAIQPITEYETALAKAKAFLSKHRCQIKVLPMTGPEARTFLGTKPPTEPEPLTPEDRRMLIECLQRVARDSNDTGARNDALDLLGDIGALQS